MGSQKRSTPSSGRYLFRVARTIAVATSMVIGATRAPAFIDGILAVDKRGPMTRGSGGARLINNQISGLRPSIASARISAWRLRVEDDHAQRRRPHGVSIIANRLLQFSQSLARNVMTPNRETVLRPAASEADLVNELRDHLDAMFSGPRRPYLLGSDGERIELPDSALEALRIIIEAMAAGQSITLVPHGKELTSQEAADILHVSRPHLIKLLDRSELPFHRVGTHRRIRIEDVLAYRDRRDAALEAALDELARLSEELPGGYR